MSSSDVQFAIECARDINKLKKSDCKKVFTALRSDWETMNKETKIKLLTLLDNEKREFICKEIGGFSDLCIQMVVVENISRNEIEDFTIKTQELMVLDKIEKNMSKSELAVAASDVEKILLDEDEDEGWCKLNFLEIANTHLTVAAKFGVKETHQQFKRHMELFQQADKMTKEVIEKLNKAKINHKAAFKYFETLESFCSQLSDYNDSLKKAKTLHDLDRDIAHLETFFKKRVKKQYEKTKTLIGEYNEEYDTKVEFIPFKVIRWMLQYWIAIYIVGNIVYNLYYVSELFVGVDGWMNVIMKICGVICLAFVQSGIIATKLISFVFNQLTSVITSIMGSFHHMLHKIVNTKAVKYAGAAFRFISTSFLTNIVRNIMKTVCITMTQATSLGFAGMASVFMDSVTEIVTKGWTTVAEYVQWITATLGGAIGSFSNWGLQFIKNYVWTDAFNTIFGSTIGPGWNWVSGLFKSGAATAAMSKFKTDSVISDALQTIAPTKTALAELTSAELLDVAVLHMKATDPKLYNAIAAQMPAIQQKSIQALDTVTETVQSFPKVFKALAEERVGKAVQSKGYEKLLEELQNTKIIGDKRNVAALQALDTVNSTFTEYSEKPAQGKLASLIKNKYINISGILMILLLMTMIQNTII